MPSPLLSVIVPVYNTQDFLAECLDSICSQTYKHLEIICVNDGSTDNSPQILAQYEKNDSRIRIIHQDNAGLAEARNTGIEAASGELITFVDSDDYLRTDAYGSVIPYMTDDIDLVCFSVEVVGKPGERYNKLRTYFDIREEGPKHITQEVIFHTSDTAWCKLYRRSVIDKYHIRFPKGLWYEDFPFKNMYMSVCSHMYCCQEKLYIYILREDSIMGKTYQGDPKTLDRIKGVDTVFSFLKQNGMWQTNAKQIADLTTLILTYFQTCPPCVRPKFQAAAKELIFKWNLHKLFPNSSAILSLLYPEHKGPLSCVLRLFYSRKRSKISYRFLGIPLYTRKVCGDKKKYEVLGIPVRTKTIS